MIFNEDRDRPDIQLERDRQQQVKTANYWANFNKPIPSSNFSDDPENLTVTGICRKLIQKGGGKALYYKHQIFWDKPSISDTIDELLLECLEPETWDEPLTSQEQIAWYITDKGHEYEIVIELFDDY